MAEVGDVLAAKYRLEGLLGSGGMGQVYRAVNEDVGRRVAIKILRTEHATNAPIVERFLREARAANLVRHPNVVDVLDVGRSEDGSPFIVQELLEGEDLLKYAQDRGGKLTVAQFEAYVVPVIEAVAEAHAHGVVHRDLKPENVFLASKGKERVPKLLDFGISKIRHPSIRATEVAVTIGTPAYMAPEQVQGTIDADVRTDVWSLGIMMFELLSGTYPFESADSPALFVNIATKDAPALASVTTKLSADLCSVVDRCLKRDPDQRYANAGDLAVDLRRVLGLRAPAPQMLSLPPLAIPDLALPSLAPPPAKAPKTQLGGSMPPPAVKKSDPKIKTAPAVREIEIEESSPALMLAETPGRARRPNVVGWEPTSRRAPEPDFAPVVGLAVVGATAIGATAMLSAFLRRPEGLPVLTWVTQATPTTALVVHAALALVCLIAALRTIWGGVKQWRGEVEGGRSSAIVRGAFGGAIFFVAIELARAAF
jgi:eukaryotic-like serine/threonine-protein kinase